MYDRSALLCQYIGSLVLQVQPKLPGTLHLMIMMTLADRVLETRFHPEKKSYVYVDLPEGISNHQESTF